MPAGTRSTARDPSSSYDQLVSQSIHLALRFIVHSAALRSDQYIDHPLIVDPKGFSALFNHACRWDCIAGGRLCVLQLVRLNFLSILRLCDEYMSKPVQVKRFVALEPWMGRSFQLSFLLSQQIFESSKFFSAQSAQPLLGR